MNTLAKIPYTPPAVPDGAKGLVKRLPTPQQAVSAVQRCFAGLVGKHVWRVLAMPGGPLLPA